MTQECSRNMVDMKLVFKILLFARSQPWLGSCRGAEIPRGYIAERFAWYNVNAVIEKMSSGESETIFPMQLNSVVHDICYIWVSNNPETPSEWWSVWPDPLFSTTTLPHECWSELAFYACMERRNFRWRLLIAIALLSNNINTFNCVRDIKVWRTCGRGYTDHTTILGVGTQ
jgi:hypothetical protein